MKTYFILVILLVTNAVLAAPQPTRVKLPGTWTLDVTFENPQQICVRIPGNNTLTRFWYMILTLTNDTGHDVRLYPDIWLTTDTFQSVQASKDAIENVFNKIRTRHQGRYPFIEPFEFVDKMVLQGADNAKDLAVIFPDFDPCAKQVSIFIGGLSNETAIVNHPTEKDQNGDPVKVVLKKTLELQYAIPGDPSQRDSQTLDFIDKRWVMR
ncbi:MAG: hypothetical protein Q7T18_00095 [Sedimentisphaerales bacterium]|nr:hypothetical protein [Sedimentisphaerales bacterium]